MKIKEKEIKSYGLLEIKNNISSIHGKIYLIYNSTFSSSANIGSSTGGDESFPSHCFVFLMSKDVTVRAAVRSLWYIQSRFIEWYVSILCIVYDYI